MLNKCLDAVRPHSYTFVTEIVLKFNFLRFYHTHDMMHLIVATILSLYPAFLAQSPQWIPRRRIAKSHLGGTSASR